jgi:hypothetical protein
MVKLGLIVGFSLLLLFVVHQREKQKVINKAIHESMIKSLPNWEKVYKDLADNKSVVVQLGVDTGDGTTNQYQLYLFDGDRWHFVSKGYFGEVPSKPNTMVNIIASLKDVKFKYIPSDDAKFVIIAGNSRVVYTNFLEN